MANLRIGLKTPFDFRLMAKFKGRLTYFRDFFPYPLMFSKNALTFVGYFSPPRIFPLRNALGFIPLDFPVFKPSLVPLKKALHAKAR